MRWTAWSTVVALLFAAPSARAQGDPGDDAFFGEPLNNERVHFLLDFQGVPGCSERGLFEDALRIQLWQEDPFAPGSPWHLEIRVIRAGGGYTGSGELRRPNGQLHWRHTIRRSHPCYAIVSTLALEAAVAVTPLPDPKPKLVCPQAKPGPAPEPVVCPDSRFSLWPAEWPLPPLEKPKPDPPKPPEKAPRAVRIGASVWPELIATGRGSFGVSIEAGARYRAVSLSVEAHGDPSLGAVAFQNVGAVSFARLSGALLLCGHWGWFTGCGVGDAGSFFFPNHVEPLPASVFYGAAGVRAGLEFPIVPTRLFLRAAIDMRAPIHAASYTVHGTSLFSAAGPSFGLGLGLLTELPL